MSRAFLFSILFALISSLAIHFAVCDEIDYYSPKNILRFADYLYRYGDYLRAAGEYQRYLFLSPEDSDSSLYKIGLCYRRAGNIERGISFFRKVTETDVESRFRFSAFYQIAYSYFLSGQYENSVQFLNQFLDEAKDDDERGKFRVLMAFNHLHRRQWGEAEHVLGSMDSGDEELNSIASELRLSAIKGVELPRRNPLLAGLFSAVVPGSGKMYCKEYGDGIYSLILIAGTALLAWDGFNENGVRSVRGWIFGGIGGIFYAGNVYGSSAAARVYNRQLETELLNRIPTVPDNW